MKTCPNCNAEVEDNFELCWNCNYSFTEKHVIEIKDSIFPEKDKDIDCLRCNIPLIYTGNYKFHEGFKSGIYGFIGELFVNRESFDLYICPKCGKVEFYAPL